VEVTLVVLETEVEVAVEEVVVGVVPEVEVVARKVKRNGSQ